MTRARRHFIKPLSLTLAAMSLAACVSTTPVSTGRYTEPVGGAPVISNETPYSRGLSCIASYNAGHQAPRIAVGQIADYTGKEVGAEVDIEATGVGGDLLIGATALCNGASISTDPDVTAVNSNQLCGAKDPSATVNADVSDVAGGVGIAAMAVSNQIQVDSNANNFPMNSYQENRAGTYATVNATISNVGAVDLSSTAVGNSATFIHYP